MCPSKYLLFSTLIPLILVEFQEAGGLVRISCGMRWIRYVGSLKIVGEGRVKTLTVTKAKLDELSGASFSKKKM